MATLASAAQAQLRNPPRTTTRQVAALVWTANHPGGIQHTVRVVPVSPAQGDTVEFTSVIKNTGSEPIELELTEGISVGGDLSLDAPAPTPGAFVRRLAPGESYTQRISGVVRSSAGTYHVTIPGPYAPLAATLQVRSPR